MSETLNDSVHRTAMSLLECAGLLSPYPKMFIASSSELTVIVKYRDGPVFRRPLRSLISATIESDFNSRYAVSSSGEALLKVWASVC